MDQISKPPDDTVDTWSQPNAIFRKRPQVACHDMFKLMDRQSLIEGLHPKGESPEKLDPGTIEFEEVKFFYPFRPEIQVGSKRKESQKIQDGPKTKVNDP